MSGNVRHLTALDAALAERFVSAAAVSGTGDWGDVESRAESLAPARRRRSRRGYLAVVAAALGVALASPALGLPDRLVDFFQADPAAGNVVLDFSRMNERGSQDPSLPAEARAIHVFELPSGARSLSVAPTKNGSFCWAISEFSNGCQAISPAERTGNSVETNGLIGLTFSEIPVESTRQDPVLIGGNVSASASAELELRFEDGGSRSVPFVWVSEPIGAGFFLYELPQEQWTPGKRPVALELRDGGELISRVSFSVAPALEG